MVSSEPILKLNPISLLKEAISNYKSNYLQVSIGLISWHVHFKDSKLTYASYAIASHPMYSLIRLKHHLNRMGYQAAATEFENSIKKFLIFKHNRGHSLQYPEYQAILWLVNQRHLNPWQAKKLIEVLVQEVLELFLFVTTGKYQFNLQTPELQTFCKFDPQPIIDKCQKRLQVWQSLTPIIQSPYQRPYISNQAIFERHSEQDKIAPTVKYKLGSLLQGYSISHLAAILKQDELEIAKFLHPYVVNSSIGLREPESPFDQLHQIYYPVTKTPTNQNLPKNSCPIIACVDDSPNTLNEIERLLGQDNFSFFKFVEPIKAAILLRRIKPNIIFLDINMPTMNGYELCRLLRKHPSFQETPIVMVTGTNGGQHKEKAKVVGASDYLTKPFTKSDLETIVSKYLT
ncbi:MAG: response regulator [Symploca sp. SIO3C6]|uniref:Response regulator n=1 Tax=Symploca sp. SIO1C4 TaxID=2607765 RepID=A0A6B3NGU0_9CYAN|nr:response regulator [Symploca sp. SIO3C6]NER30927.1 response regulator [Symploca sp. SIO1C4]NET04262.1 response regulator [Symploca sp. SIO2B6]